MPALEPKQRHGGDAAAAPHLAVLGHLGVVDGGAVRRSRPAALVSREAGQTRLFPALPVSREVGHAPSFARPAGLWAGRSDGAALGRRRAPRRPREAGIWMTFREVPLR